MKKTKIPAGIVLFEKRKAWNLAGVFCLICSNPIIRFLQNYRKCCLSCHRRKEYLQ